MFFMGLHESTIHGNKHDTPSSSKDIFLWLVFHFVPLITLISSYYNWRNSGFECETGTIERVKDDRGGEYWWEHKKFKREVMPTHFFHPLLSCALGPSGKWHNPWKSCPVPPEVTMFAPFNSLFSFLRQTAALRVTTSVNITARFKQKSIRTNSGYTILLPPRAHNTHSSPAYCLKHLEDTLFPYTKPWQE